MSDYADRLARQVREALGAHNDENDAVVLLVRALVTRETRLAAFAAAVRDAVDTMGYVPEIQGLLDEHEIDALLPPVEPAAPLQRPLEHVDTRWQGAEYVTFEPELPGKPPRITLTRNGRQVADLGPGEEIQFGNRIWSYGPNGLTSRNVAGD